MYYFHSFYQVQGAYANLNQKQEKYLGVSVEAATLIIYYDDPLRLEIPYEFLVKNSRATRWYAQNSIIKWTYNFLYMYPIICGLICLWMTLVAA